MAIDTRDKRSSAIHIGQPWRGQYPLPDSSINQADRQHVALLYRGIAAGGAAAVSGMIFRSRVFHSRVIGE